MEYHREPKTEAHFRANVAYAEWMLGMSRHENALYGGPECAQCLRNAYEADEQAKTSLANFLALNQPPDQDNEGI